MTGPTPGGDVAGKDAPPALGEVTVAGSVGSVATGAGAGSWLAARKPATLTRPCPAVSGTSAEETAPGACAAATCGPATLPPVGGSLPGTWSGQVMVVFTMFTLLPP